MSLAISQLESNWIVVLRILIFVVSTIYYTVVQFMKCWRRFPEFILTNIMIINLNYSDTVRLITTTVTMVVITMDNYDNELITISVIDCKFYTVVHKKVPLRFL